MSNYEVRRVGNNANDRKGFLKLPWKIYASDPNWVPPLGSQVKDLCGFSNHPFYNENFGENFVVARGGQIIGRVRAMVNVAHNARFEEKRGFLGFFECEDDAAAADHLLSAACDYLKEQGMDCVRGPVNPSLNYEVGMLVEGYSTPPTFMMTYNRPYYESLWTAVGFEKSQDLYAFEGHIDMIADLDPKLAFVIEEIKRRFDVKVRRFDLKNFADEVALFLDIYNKSLVGTWGFVPLSTAEVKHLAKELKHLLLPELTTIIEVDGKPIGAGLGLLDFNPTIKKIGGRLFPFGFIKLLMSKRKIDRVRLMSTNVLPEFQKWGFGLLALERMLPDCLELGIKHGEFSWVLESNHLSRGSLERSGLEKSKTYRLYDKTLS